VSVFKNPACEIRYRFGADLFIQGVLAAYGRCEILKVGFVSGDHGPGSLFDPTSLITQGRVSLSGNVRIEYKRIQQKDYTRQTDGQDQQSSR